MENSNSNASNGIAVVDGYDVRLSVDGGHLAIRDGWAVDGKLREQRIGRGRSNLARIIVRAPSGMISISALDWCNRMSIPVAVLGSDSRMINCFVPDHLHDGPVKRAQALCGVTGDAVRLARWLLERKIQSQIQALTVDFPKVLAFADHAVDVARVIEDLRGCMTGLTSDSTLVAFLSREAMAAQRYWQVLAGTPLPWPEWTKKRIPDHWMRVWPRQSGARALVRDATDPFNAMLNYGYTLLEVEGRVACAAYGLDSDLGLLHVDDRLRESFIYDLIEPIRATVDYLCLELACRKGLRPYMFHELRNGVVRLDPDLARDLAVQVMPKLRKPMMDIAAAYVAQVRKVNVPYVLERASRQFSSAETAYERSKQHDYKSCEYCKQPLQKRGSKFCGRE